MAARPALPRLALVLTLLLALGCSIGTPSPSPSPLPSNPPTQPPPTGAPTPSPTPSLTPTQSPPELLGFPAVGCCRGTAIQPGRYQLPRWLGIPFALAVPEGWRVLNESAAGLFMLGRGENLQGNPIEMIVFIDATEAGSPETLSEGFRGAPQLAELAPPSEVSVGEFSGILVDMSALPNPEFQGDPQADIPPGVQYLPSIERYFTPGFVWTTSSPEARVRTIWLTVGEQTALLYLEGPPDDFEAFTADAQAILDSVAVLTP